MVQVDPETLLRLVQRHAEEVDPLFVLVAALLVGVGLAYKRSGRVTLSTVPKWTLRLLPRTVEAFRRRCFRQDTDDRHVVVEAAPAEVRNALVAEHFAPHWFIALFYVLLGRDEHLNCRRVEPHDGDAYDVAQVHVRGFPGTGPEGQPMTTLLVHREPCPLAHPALHWWSRYLEDERGVEAVSEALDGEDIPYRVVTEE